ncbi:MAG: protein kinase [Verrucomicrobia bacterium]|nr:protein kinase [Verrucomicrobiota bacterium]
MTSSADDSPVAHCGDCGQPLPGGRLGALCPHCLLQLAGAEAPEEPDEAEPAVRQFGDFELLGELARGGMGVVYRARQRSLGRVVALKMIRGAELADAQAQGRFQREAHAAASLHHPHIVPVYEIGEHELQPYFTMRLVPGGETIADWAARHRGEPRKLAGAVAQVARAVAHAHERGVLHRDLKPGNVLWDPELGPQVTDFGLARVAAEDSHISLSRSGEILGSPSYMAPEQASGRRDEVTTASDVYGLGALLYEVLTGQPPFRAESPLATLDLARQAAPVPPSRLLPKMDRDLETICLKCLEKSPAHRYPSARELAEELERCVRGETIRARRASPAARLWRWSRRQPALAASLAGALGVLLAGLFGIAWQWRKAELARAGEQRAHRQGLVREADLLAAGAFAAVREGDPSRAALWFAHAAVASADPLRSSVNSLRWRAWRDETATAVRALPVEADYYTRLFWHPGQVALAVQNVYTLSASVWDLATESRWEPAGPLTCVQWLPDGRLAGWHDGTLRVLEYPSGREVLRVPVPGVLQIAVSADGRWLGLGGPRPLLCEIATGKLVALPVTKDRPTEADQESPHTALWVPGMVQLEFDRLGQHVLLTGRGWRATCPLATPERFAAAPVESIAMHEFGFVGEGRQFISLTRLTRLSIYDAASGAVVREWPLPEPTTKRLPPLPDRLSPDGRFLARHSTGLVDLSTGVVRDVPRHSNMVGAHAFRADSQWVVSACADDTVRLWNLSAGSEPGSTSGQLIGWHQDGAVAVAFSPDERWLATAQAGDGLARIWRLPRGLPVRRLPLAGTSRVQISADERWLLPAGWTDVEASLRSTRVHRLPTLEPGPELDAGGLIMHGAFAPDGTWAVLGVSAATTAEERQAQIAAADPGRGQLQIWDFENGRRLGEPIELPVEPRALAVHPGGRRIGVVGAGRSLYEYDRDSGRLQELQPPERKTLLYEALTVSCRYSPDGRVLLGLGRAVPPRLFESGTGRRVPASHLADLAVWSADFHGDILATGTRDAQIDFTRVPSGERVGERQLDANWLFVTQFDPLGERLMVAGRSRAVRIYDWRQARLVGPAMVHDTQVYAARFLPGARQIVTGEFSRVRFWDIELGQQLLPKWDIGTGLHQLYLLADRTLVVVRKAIYGDPPGIDFLDLGVALAGSKLAPEDAIALAEIDASAVIRNGTIDPLTAADWLRRWREFRARLPEVHRW